jgi:hypothetical protein
MPTLLQEVASRLDVSMSAASNQATETLLTCFTHTTSYNQASGKHICISLARLIFFFAWGVVKIPAKITLVLFTFSYL